MKFLKDYTKSAMINYELIRNASQGLLKDTIGYFKSKKTFEESTNYFNLDLFWYIGQSETN